MSGRQPRTRRQSSRAQEKALKQKQEERERQREHQREQQREQVRLQQAFNQQGDVKKSWIEDILDTHNLEDRLDKVEIRKVRGVINRQLMLSNLTEAEVHDAVYKLEVMKYKIFGEFPPEESAIQGPIRAFLRDDENENLTALTGEQRNAIDQIIMSLQQLVRRSREGFEREQINTSIARSESSSEKEGDDDSGGLGLFG